MIILNDITRRELIDAAHKEACNEFFNNQYDAYAPETDMNEGCSVYKSKFLQTLTEKFSCIKERIQDGQNLPYKRLPDRLAEMGVTEYNVTTPPLCLTVKYNGMTISFMHSYEGSLIQVDGFQSKIWYWDEDIVELIEIIYMECQEANIIDHVGRSKKTHMTNKIENEMLVSFVLGIIKARLSDLDYEIKETDVRFGEVTIEIETLSGTFYVSGTIETFTEELEKAISDIYAINKHKFDCNI